MIWSCWLGGAGDWKGRVKSVGSRGATHNLREEVTCRIWAVGDESEDFRNEALLDAGFLGVC